MEFDLLLKENRDKIPFEGSYYNINNKMEYDFLLKGNGAKNPSDGPYYNINRVEEPMIKHPSFLYSDYTVFDTINTNKFERIFPENKMNNIPDMRPISVNVSNVDTRINNKHMNNKVVNTCNKFVELPPTDINKKVHLSSGKLDADTYFNNIDVESRLKNIDFNDTRCFVKDYKKNSDLKVHPEIIEKDYRIPVIGTNINKQCNFSIPENCDNSGNYHFNDVCEKMFNNNTRAKTLNSW
jgi:hypothetical protein